MSLRCTLFLCFLAGTCLVVTLCGCPDEAPAVPPVPDEKGHVTVPAVHLIVGSGTVVSNASFVPWSTTLAQTATGSVVISNRSLLCPPRSCSGSLGNYTQAVYNMICRQSGFEVAVGVKSHRVSGYTESVDCCGWADSFGRVSLDVSCPENPVNPDDCSWGEVGHDRKECTMDDTLVIECSNQRYEVTRFEVLANPDGQLTGNMTARAGTLVATILDRRLLYSMKSLVQYNNGDHDVARNVCHYLGYGVNGLVRSQRETGYQYKLSCGYIEENGLKAVVHEIYCSSRYYDPRKECRIKFDMNGFDKRNAETVSC